MAYCPSQDWDRYCHQQDEDMAVRIAWWQKNQDRVLAVACAILSNPNINPFAWKESKLIEESQKIVAEITQWAESPE